jgi:hypothetical protein
VEHGMPTIRIDDAQVLCILMQVDLTPLLELNEHIRGAASLRMNAREHGVNALAR